MEPLLIIYSHSSFLDITYIAADILKSYKNKILLIDETFDKDDEYKKYFIDILKYKNSTPYATRLQEIKHIQNDYFIIIHDIDLLIKYDANILNQFEKYMKEKNIDKIEFQYWAPPRYANKRKFEMNNPEINFNDICGLYRTSNVNMIKHGYALFNVNPTMWKKESFLKIMYKFSHLNYKQIEIDIQLTQYVANMNCYSLLVNNPINCGHFIGDYFFLPLHILRHGKIFNPEQMHRFGTSVGADHFELDEWVFKRYTDILNKYFIGKTKRQFLKGFPG